jgi:hypothetical protein
MSLPGQMGLRRGGQRVFFTGFLPSRTRPLSPNRDNLPGLVESCRGANEWHSAKC